MILLPGCLCCDPCPCEVGKLPSTITVTFADLVNKTHAAYCAGDAALVFVSSFGSGAQGYAVAPGGTENDAGPLSKVILTKGGSGYAAIGRSEPTLTISGDGEGATFTPTLARDDSNCGVWSLESVAVEDGTSYTHNSSLTITAAVGDTTLTKAVAKVQTGRKEPAVTATVGDGGAVLAVTLSQNAGTPSTWGVDSVTVTEGGDGYADGASVTFTVESGGVEVLSAEATIEAASGPPADEDVDFAAYAFDEETNDYTTPSAGSGATWSYTWTPFGDPEQNLYELSVAIVDGGQDYAAGELLVFRIEAQGKQNQYFVDTVDENGAITGIVLDGDTTFAGSGGAVTAVNVTEPGSYYADDGIPVSVTVVDGGGYYAPDPEAPPCAADIDILVPEGCGGSGAQISATVDTDLESPTYGQITALTIDEGGDDYLIWEWACLPMTGFNDAPYVLTLGGDCTYTGGCSGSGAGNIYVEFHGIGQPLRIILIYLPANLDSVRIEFETAPVTDCSDLPGEGTLLYGAPSGSVTVTAGGEYPEDDPECPPLFTCPGLTCEGTVPFTLLCDGNEGECVPNAGIGPSSWQAEGISETLEYEPFGEIIRINTASLECLGQYITPEGECVYAQWLVRANKYVSLIGGTTDTAASISYYALVDADEDGWPVAGVVTLIEGTPEGDPAISYGCPDGPGTHLDPEDPLCCCTDLDLNWADTIAVEITRP